MVPLPCAKSKLCLSLNLFALPSCNWSRLPILNRNCVPTVKGVYSHLCKKVYIFRAVNVDKILFTSLMFLTVSFCQEPDLT